MIKIERIMEQPRFYAEISNKDDLFTITKEYPSEEIMKQNVVILANALKPGDTITAYEKRNIIIVEHESIRGD